MKPHGTLAGERDADVHTLANTQRWIDWFEEIVGCTVTSREFARACQVAPHREAARGED